MADLYLLFNHAMTPEQEREAREVLEVDSIHEPPPDIRFLWQAIPSDAATLEEVLSPVFAWLENTLHPGDYLLVQGEHGATCLVVHHAHEKGIIPIYATTRRQAEEQRLDDGSVRLVHTVRHVRFRTYGK
ncbi:CRISPR-associated protein Csx20 [Desulfolithobacter sp.]